VLILLNYSNAALTLPDAVLRHDLDFLALILFVVTALCFVAFASGSLIARLCDADRNSKVSLMFGLGMNNIQHAFETPYHYPHLYWQSLTA
jgi:BASS family bile acid:Na+ symporter